MRLNQKLVFSLLTLSCLASISQAGIFGADDRRLVQKSSPEGALGKSISMSIQNFLSESNAPGTRDISVDQASFCAGEKFRKVPSSTGACVGFLVAPDVMVTVGHCSTGINTEIRDLPASEVSHCFSYEYWLFEYQVGPGGAPQTERIPQDRFFQCKKVIYAINDEHSSGRDFALIQLDRPALNRPVLKLATSPVKAGDRVFSIGHPLGMPQIIAKNGQVMEVGTDDGFFTTNLDALDGNSGSPVFNSRSEVVGLISAGGPSISWAEDKQNQCYRVTRCETDGTNCTSPMPRGVPARTDVVRIELIREKLEEYLRSKSR